MNSVSSVHENGGLTVSFARTATTRTMAWTGESDARNPGEFLNPLISRLARELTGLSVNVDISGLTYMNSATVAPLLNCLKSFDSKALSVVVTFSDVDWQRTHVQCVRAIARKLKKVTIEVKSADGSIVSDKDKDKEKP